ncbi:MAG: hypothetical protein IMF07_03080 [Proteobacteria bacterium]|nr:hypothetical protein [Pseudomonadota bacterium]
MKEQIRTLEELHDIDVRAGEIEKKMACFPMEIQKIEDALAEEEAAAIELRELLETHEKTKREKNNELSENSERLKLFEGRLRDIKTNTEYQASLKEIDQSKKANMAIEEDLLELMETVEEESKKLEEAETAFAGEKAKAEEEKKTVLAQEKKVKKELNSILAEREDKKKSLKPEVTLLYEDLKSKLQGRLLITPNDGTCTGCHMQIPPQLINEAMKLEKLYQCPHCLRIIIVHP